MSLQSQLRDQNSPVNRWFAAQIDRKASASFSKRVNDTLRDYPILMPPAGTSYTLVGTAFDYGFRWLLGPLSPDIVAVSGGRLVGAILKWKDAPRLVAEAISLGNQERQNDLQLLARCAVVLAWFENTARSGKIQPEVAELAGRKADLGLLMILLIRVPNPVVTDVYQLLESVYTVWAADLNEQFLLNPTFAGSAHVGGADADWVTKGILYDCKCSIQPRPFERSILLQALGYLLLDYEDQYKIDHIGWYYARQRVRLSYSVDEILHRFFPVPILSELRHNFREMLESELRQETERLLEALEIVDVDSSEVKAILQRELGHPKMQLRPLSDGRRLWIFTTKDGKKKGLRVNREEDITDQT